MRIPFCAVTVGAYRRFITPIGERLSVHGTLEDIDGCAKLDIMFLNEIYILMALSAGAGQYCMIRKRGAVAGGENFVSPVTIGTGGDIGIIRISRPSM